MRDSIKSKAAQTFYFTCTFDLLHDLLQNHICPLANYLASTSERSFSCGGIEMSGEVQSAVFYTPNRQAAEAIGCNFDPKYY